MNLHQNERGGAGVKFLLVVVVLALLGNAGYNYIPTAYNGQNFKQEMQTAVIQATALPSQGKDQVAPLKERLRRIGNQNGIPANALIEAKVVNNVINAHVKYSQEIELLPFGIYKYQYEFDHSATPTGFLSKQG